LNSDYKEKNEEEAEAISSTYKATLEKKKACLTEFKDKAEAKGPANIQQLLKKNLFNRT
jgi:inorganic pyrophosphatase